MTRLIFVFLMITVCYTQNSKSETLKDHSNATSNDLVARRLGNLWNWISQQSPNEETFIGRCFGIGRKLKFVMPLIIFLLGVIVTTLKFLTLFTLKGLGIGGLLLMLNVGGLFAKLGSLFKHDQQGNQYHPPQNVHFHIHNKEGQYHVDHSTTGWASRVSEGLSNTNSLNEKLELINLYRRLGFNVDNIPIMS